MRRAARPIPGVDQIDALFRQLGRHGAGFLGVAGGLVDDDLAGRKPFQQTALAKDRIADILRCRQAGHDDIALRRQRRAALGGNGAVGGKRRHRFGTQIVDPQLLFQHQAPGQRPAHIAKPDIAQIHCLYLPMIVRWRQSISFSTNAVTRDSMASCAST